MKRIAALLLLTACMAEPDPGQDGPSEVPVPAPEPVPVPVPVPPLEDPPAEVDVPANPVDLGPGTLDPANVRYGRAPKRLTVRQLRRSIPALLNGAGWTSQGRSGPVDVFQTLGLTLGEADYLAVTHPNLEPTPLFAKFMDDMAGQVCAKVVAADVAEPDAAKRALLRHPDVDRNLRFLRLKLHAIHVPEGSTDGLVELRRLHDNVLSDTGDPKEAWTAVCIAMLTAPEMMAY